MTQEKQPVIQSVFDQHLAQNNEIFFLKALHELKEYKRELGHVASVSSEYLEFVGDDAKKSTAFTEMLHNLTAGENILVGVLNSFDVLSEQSFF